MELNFKSFVMGFHEYRKIWESKSNEILEVKLEQQYKNKKFVGHLPLGKTGRFSKTIFYFLRSEYNDYKVKIVDGEAVNLAMEWE